MSVKRSVNVIAVFVFILGICDLARGETATSQSNVVATVNGRAITEEQVDAAAGADLFALEEKIYNLRKSTLEALIVEAAIADAARAKQLNSTQLKNTLLPADMQVADSEVDAEYQNNREGLAHMSAEEAKLRIRLDLESRARLEQYKKAVAAIVAGAVIERRLRPPVPPEAVVRVSGPLRGNPKAPVTIVEYSDFECPFCREANPALKKLLSDYGDRVALIYKHLPLPNHPHAFKAAQASVCAGEQGRFWEYHDRLFTGGDLSEPALQRYASELGLTTQSFNACLSATRSVAAVRRDAAEARLAGADGTPSFVVNGRLVGNGVAELRTAIEEALRNHAQTTASAAIQ
ncbi:MAG TPA: thioredoxin domain-containing protein [Thermoanaerobaculia bacterium]|nr:thioredoxin domain-containing protein [Thermoanaerobaculia bacterium]